MTLGPGGRLAAGALENKSKPGRFWLRQFWVSSITGCVRINMGMPANLRSRPSRRNQRRAGSPCHRGRVNTVSPGLIATPLWSKLSEEARQSMYEGAAARLPARRVGQPEDVANAIAYLASTPSSTVLVDGGASIVCSVSACYKPHHLGLLREADTRRLGEDQISP
ncbi:hypothetical protein PS619_03735 [Pseudomonas fluorescens]|nr:hypothetical protein PS619_03735 [Pseudomonas fluorescens]